MSLNWAKLVAENRAKAHGVAWTPEEAEAIRNGEATAEELRSGVKAKKEVKVEPKAEEVSEETSEVEKVVKTSKAKLK